MLTICLQGVNLLDVGKMSTLNIVERGHDLMVNTQMLEDTIKASGKKKTYLAEKLGISVQNFKLKCDNKSDFRTGEVAVLCSELGITKLTDKEKIFFNM